MRQHNKPAKKQILNNCNNKISKKVKNNNKKSKRKRKFKNKNKKNWNCWINQTTRMEMIKNLLKMYRWKQLCSMLTKRQMMPITLVRNMLNNSKYKTKQPQLK